WPPRDASTVDPLTSATRAATTLPAPILLTEVLHCWGCPAHVQASCPGAGAAKRPSDHGLDAPARDGAPATLASCGECRESACGNIVRLATRALPGQRRRHRKNRSFTS